MHCGHADPHYLWRLSRNLTFQMPHTITSHYSSSHSRPETSPSQPRKLSKPTRESQPEPVPTTEHVQELSTFTELEPATLSWTQSQMSLPSQSQSPPSGLPRVSSFRTVQPWSSSEALAQRLWGWASYHFCPHSGVHSSRSCVHAWNQHRENKIKWVCMSHPGQFTPSQFC